MANDMGTILFIQILLILTNGVFSCAEIAVLGISEPRLEQLVRDGSKPAIRIQRLIKEPAKFLSTIQIAITLAGFLGSAFAAEGFSGRIVEWAVGLGVPFSPHTLDVMAVIFITLVLAFFSLVFGELVPKRLAMKNPERLALMVSAPVSVVSLLFKPAVSFLSFSTNGVLTLLGIDPHEEENPVSEEEIRLLVDAGGEKGAIDKEEKEFIQNVFEFDDITAQEIATHRTDVEILWLEDDDETWANTIRKSHHTLFPVCGETPDKVVGILNSKDYFRLMDLNRDNVMHQAVSPAYFVPETIKLDVLFRNMKQRKTYLAVLLDEYGGMEGIVTLNDLLEELVGDLDDGEEVAPEDETAIEKQDDNTWLIKGNVELEAIEQATGLPLVSEEYDTFTGLIFDTVGSVPTEGTGPGSVALKDCTVQVEKIYEHQVIRAVLKKL